MPFMNKTQRSSHLLFCATLSASMAFELSGKKVLVTGAGRGLGKGIALALARAGCKVYALDNVQEFLDALVMQNADIVPINQDLSNWDETRSTLEKLETLDGLVNNAAMFLGSCRALDHTEDDMKKYMAINLFPAINCTQVVGKKMIEAGKAGSIVNMSSVVSQLAQHNQMGYCVAKAGIDMVTKQFALELGPHGIRVNSVNPTLIHDTDMGEFVLATTNLGELMAERTPLARVPKAEHVVNAVMYLLSDAAAMVTGTINFIDGGVSCNITTKQ